MGTKVKGLLKGLRYISQIFDEPKKGQEMQIGLPTDVKHVAHIGWDDGPAAHDSPSWMKGFESTEGVRQSTPSSVEDSSKRIVHRASNSLGGNQSDGPKSTRRSSSLDDSPRTDSPKKEKSRHSRRHHSKDSLGSSKLNQDGNVASDSPGRDLPDIPKKTRRKKSRDSSSSRSSKPRGSGSGSGSGIELDSSSKSRSTKDKESSEAG